MKVLVVAPHPDDEAIGCGGVIRQHVLAGDSVEVVLLTGGELGCPGQDLEETATLRIHEAFEASKVLGSVVGSWWRFPDGRLGDERHEAELKLAAYIAGCKPDLIYVTSIYDAHVDHRAAHNILVKVLEKSIIHPIVKTYEVWTPLPDYDEVVDITDVIGIKLRAIRRHESQVNRIRFDEAALSLARFRGELHNRPHGPYAEVFKRIVV